MFKFISLFFILSSLSALCQNKILFTGNVSGFCFEKDSNRVVTAEFPDSLLQFDAIFLFSSANSILDDTDVEKLLIFLEDGNGLYIGAENWPLQSESNQLTKVLFSKEVWGNFTSETAKIATESEIIQKDTMSAGTTTVAFPLDYRLKVEAWVDDEPLISSGNLLGGRIIIDGGYSRFYCDAKNAEGQKVLNQFITFLSNH